MKKYTILIVIYILPFYLNAQNLVPNPSFEDTLSCPQSVNQLYNAIGWRSFSHTPDYYNACSSGTVGVPVNQAGYHTAKSGVGYGGIFSYLSLVSNVREFAAIKLISSLTIGQVYYVSFFVSPASNHNLVGIAVNHLGCKFSVDSFSMPNPMPINNFAHIVENSIIDDTLNWTKISGSFIADSAYNYISIGSFFSDSLNIISYIDTNTFYSYYYIDDVCVSADSSTVVLIPEQNQYNKHREFHIYPNPSSEEITLKGEDFIYYEVVDMIGRIMIYGNNPQNQNKLLIRITQLIPGTYLFRIYTKNEIVNQKLIKF